MSGSLAHSPSDVIQYLLEGLGVGTLPEDDGAWPIYSAFTPDTDNCITVHGAEDILEGRLQTSGETQCHHGITVSVRAKSHGAGWTKANAVGEALDKSVHNVAVTIGTTDYVVHAVSKRSGIVDAGKEPGGSRRNLFTINVIASIRQTS